MLKMGVGTAGLPDGIFYIPKTSDLVFFGRPWCENVLAILEDFTAPAIF
jgi:hypothetical protein